MNFDTFFKRKIYFSPEAFNTNATLFFLVDRDIEFKKFAAIVKFYQQTSKIKKTFNQTYEKLHRERFVCKDSANKYKKEFIKEIKLSKQLYKDKNYKFILHNKENYYWIVVK